MENTIVSGNKRTFRAMLFSVVMLIFGGAALAATAPAVAPLKFTYTVKDANGNTITLENKITTGYEANKVAVDSSGNVYVADAVSNTVSVFNTNGRMVRQINVNRPIAIGIDNSKGLLYVGGALNGTRSIFILDNNNDENNDNGNLSSIGWDNPSHITVTAGDTIDSYGNKVGSAGDIYVADGSVIKRVDSQGGVRIYGPYGGERYASETWSSYTYWRTRHSIVSLQGVAIDKDNGLIYVSANEIVEYLGTAPQKYSGAGGSDTNYTVDTESWKYYNGEMYSTTNGIINSTLQTVTTDSSHIYWGQIDPLRVKAAVKYHILVIDMATGGIIRKISSGLGEGNFGFRPRGLALDEKGRLYVAGVDTGGTTSVGGIKVYDVTLNPEVAMTVSGFASGQYTDVAYKSVLGDSTKGRLFAAIGDSKTVSSYSIDGGTNPANTAPTAPVLLEPVSSNNAVAAVNTATPILRLRNSTDAENDPLTYSYEICSGSCAAPIPVKATSAAGIAGGSNNETSMTITQGLVEDSLYHWRAQSFDGEKATWSDEATFCVNEVNSNPTQAAVVAPLNKAIVSPFASSLSWNPSTDPDCSNDIVTYEVTVSDTQGNAVKSFSGVGSTSINVSDISGLVGGNTYEWKVGAVDGRGGSSGYSSGSFTYMTTSVALGSDQAGTKVYIDGNYGYYGKLLGAVPVDKSDIAPGSHFVTFINAGYEPHYAIINVTDPAVNAANSSVTYTSTMVNASRIKPPATGVELFKISGGNAAPFVVDYNNDGLKDLVAGGKVYVYNVNGEIVEVIDGKVYLYLSEEQVQADGSKKVVQIAKGAIQAGGVDINAGSRAVPFVADYDNDGKKDLLVGSGGGLINLYLNIGNENAPVFTAAGTIKDGSGFDITVLNSAPVVVDYNNDGKKDIVIGGFDGKLRLYKNAGTDASPGYDPIYETISALDANLNAAEINAGSNSKAFFTDWNSDGKKDLVVGRGVADSGGNTVNLFLNVGTDDAPSFITISGLQSWIKGKKKERGNREFVPYLGYNHDLGDLTGGKFEGSPFVVDWDGTSARDVIVGNGSGGVAAYITE